MEFELKYTSAQKAFRDEVRAWLAGNVPGGINARPRNVDESRALYLLRRAFGLMLYTRISRTMYDLLGPPGWQRRQMADALDW